MKFIHSEESLVDKVEIQQKADSLSDYIKHLGSVSKRDDYSDLECSISLPFDKRVLEQTKKVASAIKTPTLQYIVVIGIGGSNLGTQAIYDATAGSMNLLGDRLPKLLFLDTVSDEKMTAVIRHLSRMHHKSDFAILFISKSGGTTEVIANTEILLDGLKDHFGNVKDRLVAITGEGSKLWKLAGEQKIHRLSLPDNVGGRYSVFSAVGLLPLYLANIDLKELLRGAQKAVAHGVSKNLKKNHSLVSAIITYTQNNNGHTIHNSFLFSPKLESIGKWYRQLMGESIGKEKDLDGNIVNNGITPIVSIGSTDLHSMAQLYFGGPDDKYTNLIYSFAGDINATPKPLNFPGLVSDIQGKTLEELTKAIIGGVKSAYKKTKRPYTEIDMQGIKPYEIGYHLQFRMIEMMYLAKLMNVNAFDQPAVETYKEATRELLKS
jgi:glucose-6-phosphate isomerase